MENWASNLSLADLVGALTLVVGAIGFAARQSKRIDTMEAAIQNLRDKIKGHEDEMKTIVGKIDKLQDGVKSDILRIETNLGAKIDSLTHYLMNYRGAQQ